MTDLAILGQDPGFGGGGRAQMEAFWRAAVELGRAPRLLYLRYAALDEARHEPTPLAGDSVGPVLPHLDAANLIAAGVRLAPRARAARTRFVVATGAQHGYAALRSERPYGCWIGTGLEEEWRSRLPGLSPARRLALRLGAPALRRVERAVLRGASVVCATSPASRAAIARASGLAESGIRILPIPVDVARLVPGEEPWEERLARPELVFVGRAGDPRKNVGLLLDAFARVRERLPEARLRLVGAPPRGPVPDGVVVEGELPSIADALRRAALFVLPSLQEGFGIVVAEALACGVPALVTPCGGPEDLVRRSGAGRVLEGFESGELAETALELLSDPARLAAMGARGREHVVREHAPERLRELLRDALAELDATVGAR